MFGLGDFLILDEKQGLLKLVFCFTLFYQAMGVSNAQERSVHTEVAAGQQVLALGPRHFILDLSKARLGGALSNLLSWKLSQPVAGIAAGCSHPKLGSS